MTGLQRLHDYAEQNRILVYSTRIPFAPAVTVRDIDIDEEYYYVAVDPCQLSSEGAEQSALLHELSHIAVGAFYKNSHDLHFRQKAENRALRWQIENIVPRETFFEAVDEGNTEAWELAEIFCVEQDLMEKAMFYYKYGYIE